jgi:hypothetical protein
MQNLNTICHQEWIHLPIPRVSNNSTYYDTPFKLISTLWWVVLWPVYGLDNLRLVFLSKTSRSALWPSQSPIQWVPGPPPPRVKVGGWDMKLATHLHLVPRLQISGDIHLLPPYVCMVCTGATLPLTMYSSLVKIIITAMCHYITLHYCITLHYYTVVAVAQHLFLNDMSVGAHRLP